MHYFLCQPVMIGDDLLSDIEGIFFLFLLLFLVLTEEGAQNVGIRGILVRTGKYTPKDEQNSKVKPFLIVDNFHEAIEWIADHNRKFPS